MLRDDLISSGATRGSPPLSDRLGRVGLRLVGFESRYVRTSIGRVHWLEARGGGRLPTLVLLHGFGSSCVHLAPLLRRLQPHVRRIIAPDLPAHGFSDRPGSSMRPDHVQAGLFESLEHALGEPAVFFGNSMGGFAALRYAANHPGRVRGLVLVSPGGAPMEPTELDAFRQTFRLDTHADACAFIDRLFSRPPPFKHVFAWGLRRRMNRAEMRDLLSALTLRDLLSPEELNAITQPVLLMWGQRERILPGKSLEFFRSHLPSHAVIEEPEDYAHSPYLENAAHVADRIRVFLERRAF